MISKTFVLDSMENRLELFCLINEAIDAINDLQDEYVFDSGDLVEKDEVTYQYWPEVVDDAGWIRLADDYSMSAQYIEVSAPTEEFVDLVIANIKKHVPFLSTEALKKQAYEVGDNSEKAGMLAHLGLGRQGSYDQEIKNILVKALQNKEFEIRKSATLAIFLLKWPQFVSVLEKSIVMEEDADLSAQMACALSFCIVASSNNK